MKLRSFILGIVTAGAVLAQPGNKLPPAPTRMTLEPGAKPNAIPASLKDITIEQKLDAAVPLDLTFKDEAGQQVQLRQYFGKKPVLLALVYFDCPMLCTMILNGVQGALKAVPFTVGKDYDVLAVSFDPRDTPKLAAEKKAVYMKRYGRPETASGWHFLTGDEANIKALTDAVGFRYKWDEASKQYAHASGIQILTPEGRLSRYFYGVEYSPKDIRFGLVEASKNQIGTPADQILLYCYHYDPATGKYTNVALGALRFAGGSFVLVCGAFLLMAWRREWRIDRRRTRNAG